MSYQVSAPEAVRNAGRFLQEAGMDAVKLEGGRERLGAVRLIVRAGIPVMGHLGLTPQSVHQLGGFRPQGRDAAPPAACWKMPCCCRKPAASSLVLESVPARLAALISKRLEIPTIGIGAGSGCDGQVLVTHDLLGLFERFTPKFVTQVRRPARRDAARLRRIQSRCRGPLLPRRRAQHRDDRGGVAGVHGKR